MISRQVVKNAIYSQALCERQKESKTRIFLNANQKTAISRNLLIHLLFILLLLKTCKSCSPRRAKLYFLDKFIVAMKYWYIYGMSFCQFLLGPYLITIQRTFVENICNVKKMGAISFIGLVVIGKEPYQFYLPIFFSIFFGYEKEKKCNIHQILQEILTHQQHLAVASWN